MTTNQPKKILLVGIEELFVELIKLMISKYFSIELASKETLKDDEWATILGADDFQFVIIDADKLAGKHELLKNILTKAGKNSNVIFLANEPSNQAEISSKTIVKPTITRPLKEKLSEVLSISSLTNGKDSKQYYEFPLKQLLKFNQLSADFFIRLNDDKYVRILSSGSYFGEEDYQKYSKKSLVNLFIKVEDVDNFLEKCEENLRSIRVLSHETSPTELNKNAKLSGYTDIKKAFGQVSDALSLAQEGKLSYDAGLKVNESTLKAITVAYSKLGMTRDVQQLVKANVSLSIQTIRRLPKLEQLFSKFVIDPDSYIPSHSIMLGHICCNIASLMGWTSDTTFYKLTMAAFLHDIKLENENLARITTLSELTLHSEEFSKEELEAYLNHTDEAAKLVSEMREIPPEVDTIVAQHHERPNGKGFPRKLKFEKISPLSCVFILAHDLVDYIERHGRENWNILPFLNNSRPTYQVGVFKEVFSALWDAVINFQNIVPK